MNVSTLSRVGAAMALVPVALFLLLAALQAMGWTEPSGGCGLVVMVVVALPLGIVLWFVGLFLAPRKSAPERSPDR